MRSTEKMITMIAAVLGLAISAQADMQEIDGITWVYTVENGEATVLSGCDTSVDEFPGVELTGAISIPSTLGGYPVTIIGPCAFMQRRGLTSVTIPDGITSIESTAFRYCETLTNIIIPDSVTSIAVDAFDFSPVGAQYYAESVKLAQKSSKGTLVGDSRYDISNTIGDRVIASITVSEDAALDDFVLPSGKVYDSVVYITNTASDSVNVSMPDGHLYKTLKWMRPLTIPANSSNILTITRIADNTFLLSRQELETVQ